jgi:hypothetical protein
MCITAQTLPSNVSSFEAMAGDLYKPIDTIANPIYLIRLSLDDLQAASLYIGFGEDEIKAIRLNARQCSLLPIPAEKDGSTSQYNSDVAKEDGA